MNKLNIELTNCFGIDSLKHEFDFGKGNTFSIYARNGLMKTSHRCRTDFADIQNKKECGGNRQWQNHYLRNWAANTKGKGII